MARQKIATENINRVWRTGIGVVRAVSEGSPFDPLPPISEGDVHMTSVDGTDRHHSAKLSDLPEKFAGGDHVYTDGDEWFLAWTDGADWFYDPDSSRWSK